MEFNGEHECKLDAKGRLLLPFRLKNKLPDGLTELVVTRGLDPCLSIYTSDAWKTFAQRLTHLDDLDDTNRKLKRTLYAGTTDVEMDTQGRILIPKLMLAHATLVSPCEVIAVGVHDHIELWNAETYQTYIYGDAAALSAAAKEQANKNPNGPTFLLHRN
jgi:MraZ protein